MPIEFPGNAPGSVINVGDEHSIEGGRTWVWDGTYWARKPDPGPQGATGPSGGPQGHQGFQGFQGTLC